MNDVPKTTASRPRRALVLGIGNTLLSDEGAGPGVLDLLRQHPRLPPGTHLLDGGTLSFTLAPDIEDADALVVVDAARMGRPAGSVEVFEDEAMDRFLGGAKKSAHEVSLCDLLDMARLRECLPLHRALVGIEPQLIDWGTAPTPAVAAGIPRAADAVVALLAQWHAGPEN